ncbi:DEAD/DEAH box helicase [Ruegeria sp. HKCCD6119]|uniref:DEAD/DEAH box helicase n=1 Tax=Ruegeria sp. HKCCD6119 TaxID=2683003 RepID=UPI001492DDF3|nr:DEAD/DEAH box helicase [Ruegeria sp. HKCCD6119]
MKQTIADALARKGYDTLTQVQRAVTQPELEGRDMLVSAQTGSGKTIGFGLAIAHRVLGDEETLGKPEAPLALVVAPTRELALQVKRELGWLYSGAGAFLASCVGGMDIRDERRALARGAHIVVATPGRLRDHINRGSIDLTAIRAVVLDEADEMLDLGFREDLEFILDETPADRQTLLFSATVPRAIANLAKRYQREAVRVSTVGEQTQHADIEYRAMTVAPRDGENAIINVLRYYEAPNAIVFCNTRAMVSRLTARLSNRGFSVVALSGELTQSERSNALQAMRDGRARVCVATDVAARGIDLPNLDLVVHAELPNSHETLLHRSGRTGRAGRKGVSALIVAPSSRKKAERILKFAKLTAEWGSAPSADDVNERDQVRMLASEDWQVEITESERPSVEKLIARFTPEQIAAAYLRQYKLRHSAPEELSAVDQTTPRPRASFGPGVWFSLSEGRNQNASPRHMLPMICKAGDLTKDDIGAIRIAEDVTYFEISEASVDRFLTAIGPEMKIEETKDLVRLDKAPDLSSTGRSGLKSKFKGRPTGHKKENSPAERKAHRRQSKPEAQPAQTVPATETRRASDDDAKSQFRASGAKPKKRKPDSVEQKRGRSKQAGDAPKGPPPPKGKPNSKKNRARAAAVKSAKGGNAVPKRRKPGPKGS